MERRVPPDPLTPAPLPRRGEGRWSRQFDVGAEAAVVLVVILLDDDRAVGELRLEVETVRRAARIEGADERVPIGAVGVDGPDAPKDVTANALRFKRAVHDSAVGQHHWMQCARDVEVADLLQVRRVVVLADAFIAVVHDEELESNSRVSLGGTEAVAIAGEDDAAAGQRARSHAEDAIFVMRLAVFRHAEILGPVRRSCIRRELLIGQPNDLSGLRMNLENIGPLPRWVPLVVIAQVIEMNVVDPLAIE